MHKTIDRCPFINSLAVKLYQLGIENAKANSTASASNNTSTNEGRSKTDFALRTDSPNGFANNDRAKKGYTAPPTSKRQ
ncbi:hypothetical protein Nepgr_009332 [Nepenthes gracilis]|uniref:Uncharacterized protein n=1 Tax=Nepenthes gracilis TaxID=150966 RepID=A0AAD3SAP0_NEPGR|nr:hypothetical protein Nepgr_009332 [Nepenthes gracilis]